METTSTRNEENKIALTVTFAAEEVQKHIDAAYRQAAKVRIPGFRPGKAPRKVLENHYGGKEYFQAEATDDLMRQSLPLAIDSQGHVPLNKPEIGDLDLVEEGKEYSYTATFTVRPVLGLSSYEPVQIELPDEEPTTDEIDQQVDVMLGYYVDFSDVTDRAVEAGDFLMLETEITSDGERIESMSGDSIPHNLGSGNMPEDFDNQLLGMEIGQTKEFDLSFAGGEGNLVDEDKQAHAVVTVKAIQSRQKPELTDEFVKERLELDSVEEFRTRIADSMRARKKSDLASLKERLISAELAERLNGEPSELLITETEQGIYRDFFNTLQRSNQTLDTFLSNANISPEDFRDDIHRQATEVAAEALAFDAFARHLALEVTEDELREEFKLSGAEDPEALFAQWESNGRLSEVREGILRSKAARHVTEAAEVFEPGKKPAAKKAAAKKAAGKAAAGKDAGSDKAAKGEDADEGGAGAGKAAEGEAAADAGDAKTAAKAAHRTSSTDKEQDKKKMATDSDIKSEKADN